MLFNYSPHGLLNRSRPSYQSMYLRWSEECAFDIVAIVEFQESVDTDCGAEDTARDVGWILW